MLMCCGIHYRDRHDPSTGLHAPARACTLSVPDPSLLADAALPAGWSLAEEPRAYVGDQLFDLIDGGAVQYIDHGFQWALAATYLSESGDRMTAELYRMASPQQARDLFVARDFPAERPPVGDGARLQSGMVEFLSECCLVSLTYFSLGNDDSTLVHIAQLLADHLAR